MKHTSLVCVVLMVVTAALPAYAVPILGGPTGLAAPEHVITFDEFGNLQYQFITNQFAPFGVIFENAAWDNATNGQAGSTGFSGGDLVSNVPALNLPGPLIIEFAEPVTDAAFAAVDRDANWSVEAWLGGPSGTLVESFQVGIPFNPGIGFIGFASSNFDTIVVSEPEALSIDTLQFNFNSQAIPEPATLALLALGGLGLLRRRRA